MQQDIDRNDKLESSNDSILIEFQPEIKGSKSDDVKISFQKLEQLIEEVKHIRKQVDELKLENAVLQQLNLDDKKVDEKITPVILESNIIKYIKAVKAIANIIEILVDGLVVIVKGINTSSNINLCSNNKLKDVNISSKKIDVSGILKSTENLISSLTTSFGK